MGKPALRPVASDERAPVPDPVSLLEASELDRLSFLRRCRKELATAIDNGVPAHALARLLTEVDRVDRDIRALEAIEEPAEQACDDGDDSFDASAI